MPLRQREIFYLSITTALPERPICSLSQGNVKFILNRGREVGVTPRGNS